MALSTTDLCALQCARMVIKAGIDKRAAAADGQVRHMHCLSLVFSLPFRRRLTPFSCGAAADGQTSLHMAAGAGCFPMVHMLLDKEPWLLMRRDRAGNCAHDLALVYEHTRTEQSTSLCSFLQHCMDYPATWQRLHWTDPVCGPLFGYY